MRKAYLGKLYENFYINFFLLPGASEAEKGNYESGTHELRKEEKTI